LHRSHGNFEVVNNVPVTTGDREWVHDFIRNYQYLRGLPGLLGKGIFGNDLFLSGGDSIVKVDNNTISTDELIGICRMPVVVPDDGSVWTNNDIPYKTDEIFMIVSAQNKTVVLPNGDGTIRLGFEHKMGNVRARRFTGGNYTYFTADDAVLTAANSSSPPPVITK
jgi:hypothetical protein